MNIRLCDFVNDSADVRVKLDARDVAPLVYLTVKKTFAILTVDEATILRDALTDFIEAASGLATHAEMYAERLKSSTSRSGHRVAADQAAAPVLALDGDPVGVLPAGSPTASNPTDLAPAGADQ